MSDQPPPSPIAVTPSRLHASTPSHLGIGVIGLGFMGCTHLRAYQSAAASGFPCKLVAVADRSAERLSGEPPMQGNIEICPGGPLFDPARVRTYIDPRELLTDPAVHAVSICTHTDTHVDLAAAALKAGKHVLVEKPVALASSDVRYLAGVAKETGRLCMPAMCMRFWPEWAWLREVIRAGTHGRVLSASFQRLGAPPAWTDFYRDTTRSGGALVDLHIHDSDFIRWCFGEPVEVVSTGTIAHITTIYRFSPESPSPPHVTAEGGQDCAPGFGFRMRFIVAFERATADFDLGRTPPLLLHHDGRSEPVAPSLDDRPTPLTAYDGEIRAFLQAIHGGRSNADLVATIDDAILTARLLEAERRAIESRGAQRPA